jgi:hypothetical protein
MALTLSYLSLLFTLCGAAMMIGMWARWLRPVANNIVATLLLLAVGFACGLFAFYRGNRGTVCKLSLAIGALLLIVGATFALALNASIRGIR